MNVYRIIHNALLHNYKTVEQDGKTAANEMSKKRRYSDEDTTANHSLLKANGL